MCTTGFRFGFRIENPTAEKYTRAKYTDLLAEFVWCLLLIFETLSFVEKNYLENCSS